MSGYMFAIHQIFAKEIYDTFGGDLDALRAKLIQAFLVRINRERAVHLALVERLLRCCEL